MYLAGERNGGINGIYNDTEMILRHLLLRDVSFDVFVPIIFAGLTVILFYVFVMVGWLSMKDSYVALNEYSLNQYNQKEKIKKLIMVTIGGGLVLSVVGGLFSNFLWNVI